MQKKTKSLARSGIIAGLYVVLSVLVLPLASGAIQIRFGEAMTLLPLLFFEAVPALFVGCIIVNVISACSIIEVFTGAFITLVAAVLTYFVGKTIKNNAIKVIIGGIFPIALNALLLPLVWYWCYGKLEYVYIIQSLLILMGQAIAVYGVGSLIYFSMKKIMVKVVKKNK